VGKEFNDESVALILYNSKKKKRKKEKRKEKKGKKGKKVRV